MASFSRLLSAPERWLRSLRGFIARGDLTALLLLLALLAMPSLSLEAADWPIDNNVVLPVLVMSLIFGYVLARTMYSEIFGLLVSLVYGALVVLGISALSQGTDFLNGVSQVLTRSIVWLVDAFTGGINQDTLIFTLLVASLFWFLGYNAAWHIFRVDRVWRVIMPPGLIILGNMIVYNGTNALDPYLLTFLFAALLLVVRSNLDAREWDWYVNGIRVPRSLRGSFTRVGAVLALAAMLGAWSIPTNNLQERLNDFQEFLRSDPIQQLAELWSRLFTPIESEGPATADYFGGASLSLGGAISLGDDVVLYVEAAPDQRYYWRSRVFERYDAGRWEPSATHRVPYLNAPVDIPVDPAIYGAARRESTQRFTIGNGGTRLVYTAPQPDNIDVAARIDVTYTQGGVDSNSPVNVSVIRPTRVLERGMSYVASSQLSVASAFDLRTATTDYPTWVTAENLYLGFSVSARVTQLAREIVQQANATTPYDQAKAIETYLRQNIAYNERIPAPPANVDPVEWFLFEMQQGYCTYYATAMIVMLRSLGIPARMAAGFAQGQFDASLGQFVVRERDAHTWVEAYFPGYGWIEFEPTSAQAPLNRDGDQLLSQPEQQQIAPLPTQPPTATPTPIPSPTPDPTQAPPENNLQPQPPTPTPTPSPTPTATPVIVPTVPPPVQPPPPPNNDFLSFLLPAIGVAVLFFLTVLLLVLLGVFFYWWWEWRGMGGLSPIARAYSRLLRYLTLIGLRTGDHLTPEERRREIVGQLPNAERPVSFITRAYTVERYNDPARSAASNMRNSELADEAWGDARGAILRRWLRRFIPWKRNR